jgi:peptidoglycan-N-acetylglucosamine deacetylase
VREYLGARTPGDWAAEADLNLLYKRRVFDYISRHMLCSVPIREPRVALTFDDGPNPRETPRLLRLLESLQVQATFFLVGRHVKRYPSLAAEIASCGHEIGNHTHNHVAIPFLPRHLLLHELDGASRRIQAATGHWPRLFRPPLGWFSRTALGTLAQRGYRPVLGDVYPQDCKRGGAQRIAQHVIDRVQPGSIVILHDGVAFGRGDRSQSTDAVAMVVENLRRRSFDIGSVGHLLERAGREAAPA